MKTSTELAGAVQSYQEGNKELFNVIYEQSYRYLHTCIIHVVKDEEIAQDMLQETYFEIVKSIHTLKNTENFLSWSASIANRKCYAYLKKNREMILDYDGDDSFGELSDEEALIPEEAMQDKEKQRLIREIIDGLSDMQRMCVIRFYYNEQSQESIAEELGIPVNTVKSHLSRARANIKRSIEELDVKQGTRLYNVAPFMLVLLEEEMKNCIVKPMSSALAAGAGASSIQAGLIAKIKAVWEKLTAGAKVKIAAGVAAVCAAGAAAAAFSGNGEKTILSDEAKAFYDQMIEICGTGNFEQLCNLDYSAVDTVWDSDTWNNIQCYDKNGEIVTGCFYDGESNELKTDFTGYGIGFHSREMAIGYFDHGKAQGKLIAMEVNVMQGSDVNEEGEIYETEIPRVTVAEIVVEDGAPVGEVVNSQYNIVWQKPQLEWRVAGEIALLHQGVSGDLYQKRFVFTDRISYSQYSLEDSETNQMPEERYEFYLDGGMLDKERNRYENGQWFDLNGTPCDSMGSYADVYLDSAVIHVNEVYFDEQNCRVINRN